MQLSAIALSLVLFVVGDPTIPVISPDEQALILNALLKLDSGVSDTSMKLRIETVMANVRGASPLGLRDIPIIGLALSRASADPAACALLRRFQHDAACVK